jgi:RHS repeat-associated protein
MHYEFNPLTQNLNYRQKRVNDGSILMMNETFTYDRLDRLTSWQVEAGQTKTYTVGYADNGNITSKSDMGLYSYAGIKPHAVSGVSQLPGQALPTLDNIVEYNTFNKVSMLRMVQAGTEKYNYEIIYGPDNQRRKSISRNNETGTISSRVYVGLYEERSNGDRLHHISTPAGIAALVVTNAFDATKKEIYYLYNDYQGSLIAVLKQGSPQLEEISFDPWGRRRNAGDWNDYDNILDGFDSFYKRGYTGHEHIDNFALINMNGRMYDPRLGRFLSPDPYVQAPDYTQSYNRYSYVWNNPMKYTDPDGELVWLAPVIVGAHHWWIFRI